MLRKLFNTLIVLGQVVVLLSPQTASVNGPCRGVQAQSNVAPVDIRTAKPIKAGQPPTLEIPNPLPFKFGESLVYEVRFSKFIFSGSIGELSLSVSRATEGSKNGLIELKAEAVSKGFFTWLFGIKVKDQFRSLVDADDFGLHTSIKLLEEGKLRREHKVVIDRQSGRVTYTERDLSKKGADAKVKQAESPRWVQDVLSAIYLVRTQPLKEGDRITVPVSDACKVYKVDVIVGKREEIKIDARKFKALQLEAKIFDGHYINRSGQMIVWVTEDPAHAPVKAKVKTSGATVTIELKRAK